MRLVCEDRLVTFLESTYAIWTFKMTRALIRPAPIIYLVLYASLALTRVHLHSRSPPLGTSRRSFAKPRTDCAYTGPYPI